MKNPLILILVISCYMPGAICAQKGITLIGLDIGVQALEAKVKNPERIRADVSAGAGENSNHRLRSRSISSWGALRYEKFHSDKFSFSTGLQYSQTKSEIVQRVSLFNLFDSDFFFYRFREDGVNTAYVSLEGMVQTTDYLTVPLRVRYFPLKLRVFRLFLFSGGSVGLKLKSRSTARFNDHTAQILNDVVTQHFDQPGFVNADVHFGAGMRIGSLGKTVFGLEASLPAVSITPNSGGIVKPGAGVNVQASISVPLKMKNDE